jgi:hypothetical protein
MLVTSMDNQSIGVRGTFFQGVRKKIFAWMWEERVSLGATMVGAERKDFEN